MQTMEEDIDFIPIRGPAVDRLNRRKETGSLREITEKELRACVERSIARITASIKEFLSAYK